MARGATHPQDRWKDRQSVRAFPALVPCCRFTVMPVLMRPDACPGGNGRPPVSLSHALTLCPAVKRTPRVCAAVASAAFRRRRARRRSADSAMSGLVTHRRARRSGRQACARLAVSGWRARGVRPVSVTLPGRSTLVCSASRATGRGGDASGWRASATASRATASVLTKRGCALHRPTYRRKRGTEAESVRRALGRTSPSTSASPSLSSFVVVVRALPFPFREPV